MAPAAIGSTWIRCQLTFQNLNACALDETFVMDVEGGGSTNLVGHILGVGHSCTKNGSKKLG